jgi:hypothetical protein
MIRNPMSAWFTVLLALCIGCSSGSSGSKRSPGAAESEDDSSCPRGSKGCPCTEAGYCDKGLVCRSDQCEKRASTAGNDDGAWSDGDDQSGDEHGASATGGAGSSFPGANAGSSARDGEGGAAGSWSSETGGLANTGGASFGGRTGAGGAVISLGGSIAVGGSIVGPGGVPAIGGAVIATGGTTATGGSVTGPGGAPGTGGAVIGLGGITGIGGAVIGLGGITGTGGVVIGLGGITGIGGVVMGVGGSSGIGGGGAGGVPTCDPNFGSGDACGGDEVGSWTLADTCPDSDLLQQMQSACEGATGADDSPVPQGALMLDGETFSKWLYLYHEITLQIPEGSACLDEEVVDCPQVGSDLAALDSSVAAYCVSDSANGCDCLFIGGTESSTSGTYTVNRSSGRLTLNEGEGVYDYCVQGDFMTMRQASGSGSGSGSEEDIVQLYAR